MLRLFFIGVVFSTLLPSCTTSKNHIYPIRKEDAITLQANRIVKKLVFIRTKNLDSGKLSICANEQKIFFIGDNLKDTFTVWKDNLLSIKYMGFADIDSMKWYWEINYKNTVNQKKILLWLPKVDGRIFITACRNAGFRIDPHKRLIVYVPDVILSLILSSIFIAIL